MKEQDDNQPASKNKHMVGFSLHQDIQTNILNEYKDLENDVKIEVGIIYNENLKNKRLDTKNNGHAQKIDTILQNIQNSKVKK